MLELWLIRHGETAWNREGRWQGHSDTPLNEAGVAQGRALATRLRAERFDAVYASDLVRARHTAGLALPGSDLRVDPRLRELNFGDFEGRVWQELVAEHGPVLDRWRADPAAFRPPGGESYGDLSARVQAWWSDVRTRPGRYAVFTHGGPLRAALYGITGTPDGRAWGFALDNASISVVAEVGGTVLIRRLNDTAHLDGLADARLES